MVPIRITTVPVTKRVDRANGRLFVGLLLGVRGRIGSKKKKKKIVGITLTAVKRLSDIDQYKHRSVTVRLSYGA
jgi:hypothetical protein